MENTDSRVGFRFRPEDLALIGVLERKRRNPLYDVREGSGDIAEMYMYGPGKEPWNLFSGVDEITELSDTQDQKRKLREKYVVTELNRIGKKNCSRLAGNGCWVDKSKKKPVYFQGREVGHWRTLTYEYSGHDGAAGGKSHYYMNELHLSKPCKYVLCRVIKNLDKGCNIKFGTKRCRGDDDDQDFQPATKRSRYCEEESQASSSCSEIVQEQVEENCSEIPHEYDYTQAIDFSDYTQAIDFSEAADPAQNEEHQVADTEHQLPSMNDECSGGPDYVPNMSGVGQNEEHESWDYSELQPNWAPGCSTTMQGSFADDWSVEALMKLIP